jgi:hypothetical protein
MVWFKPRTKKLLEHFVNVAKNNPLPSDFAERMIFNIIDHPEICSWKNSGNYKSFEAVNRAIISPKVEEWLAYNMKSAYRTKSSNAANFMAEIEFESGADAAIFKMFWL